MIRIIALLCAMSACVMAYADAFSYRFNSTPLPKAIRQIMSDHDDLDVNFIYNELEKYTTSAAVEADNAYDALRQAVGLNPVAVVKAKDAYYIEALQHGKYVFSGAVVGYDGEPVIAATVMLLAPADSVVITYGVTDAEGLFAIPCDRRDVIAKLSCVGYETTYHKCDGLSVGTIIMPERVVRLGEVKVEGQNASLHADRSVYRPTQRQKGASQTGADLLGHMAIPQLGPVTGESIVTNSGQPVAIFIDYLPATDTALQAMLTADVKKVEYYDYPSDPRMRGHAHVINFVMQKYEYGGYVKALGQGAMISDQYGELLANLRVARRNMTYDIMGSAYHYDRDNVGSVLTETYRLPQTTGEIKEFQRFSNTASSNEKRGWYFAALKATYNADNVQASSQIKGRIDRQPGAERCGSVTYSIPGFIDSDYASFLDEHARFLAYEGYYFFRLSERNSLTFNPAYNYSHTEQNTAYLETGYPDIRNSAYDNTNMLSGVLKLTHDFGRYGNLTVSLDGSYESNRTRYAGSANALDRAKSSRVEAGIGYDVTVGKVYGTATLAWDWDRLQFGYAVDKPSTPKASLSLQYAPNAHNSISASTNFESWLPSPSFKSDKVIYATPLMRYTGNPNLSPSKSNVYQFSYTWIPNNDYNLSAYLWAWTMGDRYVFDYEPTPDGILRTIKQPLGSFARGTYGLSGSAKFIDRSLVFTGHVGQILIHNGKPFDADHSYINWHIRASYYTGHWNLNFTYMSGNAYPGGFMTGTWTYEKSKWNLSAGWSNSNWNIRGEIANFTRWNRRADKSVMRSEYYDTEEVVIGGNSRASIKLAATYTIGFGKKVKRDDEPSVSGSASSGILK